MFSWSYLSTLVMGVICWLCFAALWRSYRRTDVPTIRYFALFFAHFGTFFLIMGMPAALPRTFSPEQLGAFYIFGHIFLYTSFAYYSLIPTYIHRPSWMRRAFVFNLLAGAIITTVNVFYWNLVEISPNLITVYNTQMPVGPMIGVVVILNWFIGGALLFGYSAYTSEGEERIKSLLLASGMLLLTISGPIHDVSASVNLLLAADLFTFHGVVLLMLGIFWRRIAEVLQ